MSLLVAMIFLAFMILFSPTIKIVRLPDEPGKTHQVGDRAPYYEGHDNQIESNPKNNKGAWRCYHHTKILYSSLSYFALA